MSSSDAPPPQDDDFSAMLRSVRAASGTKQGVEERPMPSARPNPERRNAFALSTGGMAAIAIIIVLGLVGIVSLSTWLVRRVVNQSASRDIAAIRWALAQSRPMRRFAVPVDSSISPSEAGSILHAIGRTGFTDSLRKWERAPGATYAATPCCTVPLREVETRLFTGSGPWHTEAFSRARRGLTAEQRRFLRETSQSPAVGAMRRVAHAPAADIGGALWDVPADSQISWVELPTISPRGLRSPIYATIAAAALDVEAGRATNAELRLREVLSLGFLLSDAARSANEQIFAHWALQLGRSSLQAFYAATGRTDLAAQLSTTAANNPYRNSIRIGDSLETVLRRRLLDTTELVGVRWQLLLGPAAYLPCTSARTALFGPSARQRALLDSAKSALVKYPSDERRLGMHVRGVSQLIDPSVGFRQRNTQPQPWAGFARTVTRSRQLEMCTSLFRR